MKELRFVIASETEYHKVSREQAASFLRDYYNEPAVQQALNGAEKMGDHINLPGFVIRAV